MANTISIEIEIVFAMYWPPPLVNLYKVIVSYYNMCCCWRKCRVIGEAKG